MPSAFHTGQPNTVPSCGVVNQMPAAWHGFFEGESVVVKLSLRAQLAGRRPGSGVAGLKASLARQERTGRWGTMA